MMTGADKSEKPSLPGIEEEITGSTESLSTLENDNLTLEACEDDLFLDIRASIQRSSKHASNLTNSRSTKAATGIDNTAISCKKAFFFFTYINLFSLKYYKDTYDLHLHISSLTACMIQNTY